MANRRTQKESEAGREHRRAPSKVWIGE